MKKARMSKKLHNVLIMLVLIGMVMTLPITLISLGRESADVAKDSYNSASLINLNSALEKTLTSDNVHYYKSWEELPIHKTDEFYDIYFKSGTNPYKPNHAPSSPLYPNEYEKDSAGEYVYGNCTWYCWSRASEMLVRNGKSKLAKVGPAPSNWISMFGKTYGYRYSTSTSAQPESNSIAVYQGHVRYIDYVEGDFLIYSESGYRDTLSNDKWNGGVPTWLCYEVGTATKKSDGTWSGNGNWNYTFTVGKGSGDAKLLGYIYLDVPAVSLENDGDGWSEVKTTNTKPIESENLRIVKTETSYNYYHYCCNYYDGMNNVDSISYGSGAHHYHTLTSTSQLSASNIGDKGGKTLYKGSKCSCGFQLWAKSEAFETITYYYQEKEHTHVYDVIVTRPTCTTEGHTSYTCTECGYNYIDSITPKIDHVPTVIQSVAPTCTELGKTEGSKCSVCNEILVEPTSLAPLGHTEKKLPAKSATCTEKGLTSGSYCEVCGEILIPQNEISAKGHTIVIDSAVPPTCTESGLTEGEHCSVCNEILVAQVVADALGHSIGEWRTVKKPTCENDGVERRDCDNCDYYETRALATSGHNWTEYDGYKICESCGETEEIDSGDESNHSNCEASVFEMIWNMIVNFLRMLLGLPEICVCGEELN